MKGQISRILKDDWYKTATPQEMRVALMHLEMESMDRLSNRIVETYKTTREQCFEECAEDSGWNKKEPDECECENLGSECSSCETEE